MVIAVFKHCCAARDCRIARAGIKAAIVVAVAAFVACRVASAWAQDTQSLARAAKNPFANMTNLQFIYDANFGTGPREKTQHVLNVQPLIPFAVNADWSLITRTNIPLIAQPGQAEGAGWIRGPGDIQLAAFLSPAGAERFVWGIGPVLQMPGASREVLGQGKWSAGPAAGAYWFGKQWAFGGLINNVWSFAGSSGRPGVNQMQLQPTISYNFRDNPDRYLISAPTITANWKATGGERWTVPVSLGIGQLVKFGSQSVDLRASAYYNVVRPTDAARWTFELQAQFLFPK